MYYYIFIISSLLFIGCSGETDNSVVKSNDNVKDSDNKNPIITDTNTDTSKESSKKLTISLKGKIIDGYIKNSSICLDENLNNKCDGSELKVISDIEGNFYFKNISIPSNSLVSFISSGGVDTFINKNINFSLKNISFINDASRDKLIFITPLSNVIANLFHKNSSHSVQTFNSIKSKVIKNLSLKDEDIYKNPLLYKDIFMITSKIHQIQNIISSTVNPRDKILTLISEYIFEKNMNLNDIIEYISSKLAKPIDEKIITYIQNHLVKIYNIIDEDTSNYKSIRLEQLIKIQQFAEELSEKIKMNIKNIDLKEIDVDILFNQRLSNSIGVNSDISDMQILKNTLNTEIELKVDFKSTVHLDKVSVTASSSDTSMLGVEISHGMLILHTRKDIIGKAIVTVEWSSNNMKIVTVFKVDIVDKYSVSNTINITLSSEYEGVVNQKVRISPAVNNKELIKEFEWVENGIVISKNLEFDYIPKSSEKHILTLKVIDHNLNVIKKSITVNVKFILPLLIVMIEFNDYKFESKDTVWHSKIFSDEYGSVNDYYREISYGHFSLKEAEESYNIESDGIIKIKLNKNHPANKGQNFKDHLQEAITLADEYVNFKSYDINNNHHISIDELQIIFLVAGGESATGVSPGVWAHCSAFLNVNAPIKDGVSLMNSSFNGRYSIFGEKHFEVDKHDATIGIIAHELGHAIFKLPDLYDPDQSSNGIGYFGLMGSGSWGRKNIDEYYGQTPVHMTGWSKIKSNFILPTYITSDVTQLDLEETSFEKHKIYKIKMTNNQYFLLENRNNSGYDRGISLISENSSSLFEGGLLITHIDDNVINNINEKHKVVDIEEANNEGLDKSLHKGNINNLFFKNNKNLFNSETTPNSRKYDNVDTGIEISNISESSSTMHANIKLKKDK